MMLLFESFGFKDGIPLDANWVIDARMLPNPHYEPDLRKLTGRDPPVIAFLERQEAVGRLFEDVRGFLERWLPEMVRDNRYHVTVAIGCTGGQHRSVYLAEKLAAHFAKTWPVLVRHRGLVNEGTRRFLEHQAVTLARFQSGELTREAAQLDIEHFWAGALRRAVIDGDIDTGSVMAGQSVGMVTAEQTVAQVIFELVEQATQALAARAGR